MSDVLSRAGRFRLISNSNDFKHGNTAAAAGAADAAE